MRGIWRCISPTESMQSQWIMSDVSASSPAVFYEVTWSLTSMRSLLPQKLNRNCRILFHGVLWSTTVRATERNQHVFHWQPSWCIYSWWFLLPPWFTVLLLWCIFLYPHSPACFSSHEGHEVGKSARLFFSSFTLSHSCRKCRKARVLGIQWYASLPPFCSVWVEEHC